jgi:hypothetical protein
VFREWMFVTELSGFEKLCVGSPFKCAGSLIQKNFRREKSKHLKKNKCMRI